MKALASPVSGYCYLGPDKAVRLINIADMTPIPETDVDMICGSIDDWTTLEAQDEESLLEAARDRHWQARIAIDVESCLIGVSPRLQTSLLAEVNELLQFIDSYDRLLSRLLCAPLEDSTPLVPLTSSSIAVGFTAAAKLLSAINDAQPHLQRLADRWLSIPDKLFARIRGGRTHVWKMAIEHGIIAKTVQPIDFHRALQIWGSLALDASLQPHERLELQKLAVAVAEMLFPGHQVSKSVRQPVDHFEKIERRDPYRREAPPLASAVSRFERAQSQIAAITDAVSKGKEAIAAKYLDELVAAQTEYAHDTQYAVKSLCNIAKRCADMFCSDFELRCLQMATALSPGDSWSLIQLADCYKRSGNYEAAITTLIEAKSYGDKEVAESALADVYVQKRDYAKALEIYDGLLRDNNANAVVRTAKADAFRHMGLLDEADAEYDSIIAEGLGTDRVRSGKAEIAKRRGLLSEARETYSAVLETPDLDSKATTIYRMAVANIYLREGNLHGAYSELTTAVGISPFAHEARINLAAVEGLLGDPESAIKLLPAVGHSKNFRRWVGYSIRGLLLLLSGKYNEAKAVLDIEHASDSSSVDVDTEHVQRLSSAVWLLQNRNGVEEAGEVLDRITGMRDRFAESILAVLQYHVARTVNDRQKINRLKELLKDVNDDGLKQLVVSIDQGDWQTAWKLEVRALLRLAA